MERQNSRRRRAAVANPVASQDPSSSEKPVSSASHSPSSGRPSIIVLLFSLVLFIIIAGVLLDQTGSLPRPFGFSPPRLHSLGEEQYDHGLGLTLRPEDHTKRPPKTLTFDWSVSKGYRSPDGVRKEVYLVNDQFPGPVLEARPGDRIVVNVINSLHDEGLAIHWHGLRMEGANDMDGAVGLTQKPIPAGESFLYNFTIGDNEYGTFWYHGHEKTQRDDGLYGGLVVHRPSGDLDEQSLYDYHGDILLLVGDWYHRPSTDVLKWYMNSRSFGNEPVPDSLVVNGKGDFNCAMAVPARPVDCTPAEERLDQPLLRFERGTRYRLRLVNTGSLTGFTIKVSDASLAPFQLDGGNNIQTAEAQCIGIVYPGERIDAILLVGPSTGQEYLTIEMDDENFKYPNPALEPTQTFPVNASPSTPHEIKFTMPALDYYNLQAAQSATSHYPPNHSQPLQFVIYTTTMKLARHHNVPMGFINHTSWSPQAQPLISLPRNEYDQNQLSPHIPWHVRNGCASDDSEGWIELVINNLDDGGHPFHLHGYSFYVVSVFPSPTPWSSDKPPFTVGGSAMYNYNPFKTLPPESPAGSYNLKNPMVKDTVYIPQRGYAVIRFQANNKGIWMLHCHVGWHMGSGMAMSWDIS